MLRTIRVRMMKLVFLIGALVMNIIRLANKVVI